MVHSWISLIYPMKSRLSARNSQQGISKKTALACLATNYGVMLLASYAGTTGHP